MKKVHKSKKRTCPTTKKGIKYFFSCVPCVLNSATIILLCVGGITLYRHIKSSVFKIEKGGKPLVEMAVNIPDFASKERISWYGFQIASADVSNADFSKAGDKIDYITFDDRTVFPSVDKMPKGFDPKKIMQDGKNPGLDVRELQSKGITGKGITIAIIDNKLFTEHPEYKDNIVHYENIGFPDVFPSMFHGSATASILCGKTVGVAPDVKLVYFASSPAKYIKESDTWEMDNLHENDIKVLKKIYDMNARLPKDKRISAVSISRGEYHNSKNLPAFKEAVNKLIESGVMVLPVNSFDVYDDVNFAILYRKTDSNPDDVQSYTISHSGCMFDTGDCLLAPAGGRTMANSGGVDSYIYYGMNGGFSWAAPYIVGVYALAKQVYPNLQPKQFFEVAKKTGFVVSSTQAGYKNIIIQPAKIISYFQNKKNEQQKEQ